MLTEPSNVASLAGLDETPVPVPTVEGWYDEHAAAVFGLAVRMMQDTENAEHLVVHVFVQAHARGGRWPACECRDRLLRLTRHAGSQRLREQRASEPVRNETSTSRVGAPPSMAERRRAIRDLAVLEGFTIAELAVRFAMTKRDAACELRAAFTDDAPSLEIPGKGAT